MVEFLIRRPIAVSMVFLALLVLGYFAMRSIPVSLLPDIEIPEITVQISAPETPAQELESAATAPLRQRLMQINHLKDLQSQTRDGYAEIKLRFDYQTDMHYAFIEANEKIDFSMNFLPRHIERPRVVQARAADIPAFYLNISQKKPSQQPEENFAELSNFCRYVIKKRIEQLPEVALADISGYTLPQIEIRLDINKMQALGLSTEQIAQNLTENNFEFESFTLTDKNYSYTVKMKGQIAEIQDIKNLLLKTDERQLRLSDIAEVAQTVRPEQGEFFANGRKAVSIAVIKQANARMQDFKESLDTLKTQLRTEYPELLIDISRDQTQLLNASISNLKQSLWLAAVLAIFVLFLFLNDIRLPIVVAVTIPVALLISFMVMKLLGISINIISLAGLILCVGMMVDNSIITIDNIARYRNEGFALLPACVKATNEVIRPMLSSVLTTCAIFLPLIFLQGIAGTLFFDQAITISIGLVVSFLVTITLLPVVYHLLFQSKIPEIKAFGKIAQAKNHFYEAGVYRSFKHQGKVWIVIFLLIASGMAVFSLLKKEKLPPVSQQALMVSIDWQPGTTLAQNRKNVEKLLSGLNSEVYDYEVFTGENQFLLSAENQHSQTHAELYLKADSPEQIMQIEQALQQQLRENFPQATARFLPPPNIFDRIFASNMPEIEIRLLTQGKNLLPAQVHEIQAALEAKNIRVENPNQNILAYHLIIDQQKLMVYNVDYQALQNVLQASFSSRSAGFLNTSTERIPIVFATWQKQNLYHILQNNFITNRDNQRIALSHLVRIEPYNQFRQITAGVQGKYVAFWATAEKPGEMQRTIAKTLQKHNINFALSGSFFQTQEMFQGLVVILLISLILLYFILAAQFESLWLPFILLLEIPVDIAAALIFLYVFGFSLNLMSATGIIIMVGIIINDSILKIDTINRFRRQGLSLRKAIKKGGKVRLNSIVMTSLTSILSVLAIFFVSGLGAELQRPLAIALIGGMSVGTFVSLFFIPLVYSEIYTFKIKKEKSKRQKNYAKT